MGTVARCVTSSAEAPGICTNTSSIGTTICGSSSRGVCEDAESAEQKRGDDDQRRQLRLNENVRDAAREPQGVLGAFGLAGVSLIVVPRSACRPSSRFRARQRFFLPPATRRALPLAPRTSCPA